MALKHARVFGLLVVFGVLFGGTAQAATVVALGASNTFGKGVSPSQAYPAQLEVLLRAKGLNVNVINAGINGDTTGGMLARLENVVPKERVLWFCSREGTTDERERPIRLPRFSPGCTQWVSGLFFCLTTCSADCRTSRTGCT